MTKYVWMVFLLLIASSAIALLGAVMVKRHVLHLKAAKRFAQIGALGVAVLAYGLTLTARFSLSLDAVNMGALLLAVSVVAYLAIGFVLTLAFHSSGPGQETADSSIFTKMFPDTALHKAEFEATQILKSKDRE